MENILIMICSIILLMVTIVSLSGYGRVVTRILTPEISASASLVFSIGLSVFLSLTGFIELFRIGSAGLLIGFLLFGLLLFIVTGGFSVCLAACQNKMSFFTNSSKVKLIALFAVALFVLMLLINFIYLPFNIHDDYDGYFVFAKRILQEGCQGCDPFNVRSIEQGFGSGNYLNALFLIFLPFWNIRIAEAGIGSVLLIFLALDHIRLYGVGFWKSLSAVIVVCIVIICAPIVNISPMLTGCAVAYSIFLFCVMSELKFSIKRSILLGLLLASLVLLKGSFIIPAAIAVMAYYFSRLIKVWKPWVFYESLFTFVTMMACLMPWMIANLSFNETAFYPILGSGIVRTGSFGFVDKNSFIYSILKVLPFYALLLIAWIGTFRYYINNYFHVFFSMVIVLSTIAIGLLMLTPAGNIRYAYITLVIPTAFLIVTFIGIKNNNIAPRFKFFESKFSCAILFTAAFIAATASYYIIQRYANAHRTFSRGIIERINTNRLLLADVASPQFYFNEKRISLLQASIPMHATVAVRLDMPFLLDFSRNRIHVMDWPGGAGPVPGTPYSSKPEKLAQYMRSNGVRYLAYSYKNEAFHSKKEFSNRLQDKNKWIRQLAFQTFAVQDQIVQLGIDYKVIYDNGNDFVIDLCKKNVLEIKDICPSVL